MPIADSMSKPINLETCSADQVGGFHAYLFNLVVFSPFKHRTPYLQRLVQSIADNFLSRVLFVEIDDTTPNSEPVIQFQSSALRKEPNITGYEEITFKVPKDQSEKVSFLLLPYLLPDLPVVMLWGQDPTTEHEILPQLIKFSNRLIFDSETAEDLARFSHRILTHADTTSTDLVDLNWARIKGWRDAFDEVFDCPARLEQLTLAKKISITYNSRQDEFFHHCTTQALYLQGWLSHQLGWKLRHLEPSKPTTRVVYFTGSGEAIVELRGIVSDERTPGAILGVEIEGAYENDFSLVEKSGTPQAMVHISSKETCELPFSVMISGPRLRYQFLKDLFYSRSSRHYLNTLRVLSHQDWKQ
ncbi:MAG: hypothetical protein E6Q59_02870 [Nitrosomonas sp.]|nr:MAG: hypothetical protein E6Q59_02870 [Nitrosomonas sp.]